jgi:lipoyl(octanoyl) transferase
MEYGRMLAIQEQCLKMRQSDDLDDILILCEHPPVITLGKNAQRSNILYSDDYLRQLGIEIFPITRGGDVTFHGPGQLVGYPIVHLKNWDHSIRLFVDKVEESIIHYLSLYHQIQAQRIQGLTGVWVGQEKITAIGFAVQKWVTMHGFAFNITTDLNYFNYITPCGIRDKGVTSLTQLLGKLIDMAIVIDQLGESMESVLPCKIQELTLKDLIQRISE